ncbi:MAG: type I glutamate--ammonia ligase [bacterium]
MTREEIFKRFSEDSVKFIQLQFTDLYGVVKSLTIPAEHFSSCLQFGTWFDGSSIEGFCRIAESDMYLKPDLNTYNIIPWLNCPDGNTARFICDIFTPDGQPFEGDPRYILKKALKEAKDMGYEYKTGPELEFFLFKKNDDGKIIPNDSGGYFDLSMDEAYEVRREMTIALEKFGINVEASHHEVAIGQHEIDFKYDEALRTADNAVTFRFVLKAIAGKHGLHATFMPKPIQGINGSGMHVHQSLFKIGTDENIFYDASNPYSLSNEALNFIAGQLKHIKAMSAVLSPTVNSYKRLTPGYEAPVYISWAKNNRSALIRIPRFAAGNTKATRAELRSPDPACNIYLSFAVMLKAGLEGIKDNLLPPNPIEEDLYHFDNGKLDQLNIETLPGSLWQALQELKKDPLMVEALGEHIYKKYLEAKNSEWDEYRLQVTPWEIEKYLEMY